MTKTHCTDDLGLPGGWRHYLYINDGNGNVAQLMRQSNGAIVAKYQYDAFGNATVSGLSGGYWPDPLQAAQPFRYQSKYFHAPSGLVDFGFRFYNPSLGRWINRDPIGEAGGINLYGYVGNDPVNKFDPNGLIVESGWDAANVALGTVALVNDVRTGNYGWAAVDAAGLAYDGLATAVPFLPGGGATAIKVSRGAAALSGARTVVKISSGAGILNGGRAAGDIGSSIIQANRVQNSGRIRCPERGGRGRFKRGQDAVNQLEEITEAQNKVRKGQSDQIIDTLGKSKQREQNALDRIKTLKDALEEFD